MMPDAEPAPAGQANSGRTVTVVSPTGKPGHVARKLSKLVLKLGAQNSKPYTSRMTNSGYPVSGAPSALQTTALHQKRSPAWNIVAGISMVTPVVEHPPVGVGVGVGVGVEVADPLDVAVGVTVGV